MEWLINEGKRLGFKVKGLVAYNESLAHSDAYLAGKAKEFACAGAER